MISFTASVPFFLNDCCCLNIGRCAWFEVRVVLATVCCKVALRCQKVVNVQKPIPQIYGRSGHQCAYGGGLQKTPQMMQNDYEDGRCVAICIDFFCRAPIISALGARS